MNIEIIVLFHHFQIIGQILQDNKGASWLEKFKSVADDTDSILKLFSNISARLARTENQMLSSSRMDEEKVCLVVLDLVLINNVI